METIAKSTGLDKGATFGSLRRVRAEALRQYLSLSCHLFCVDDAMFTALKEDLNLNRLEAIQAIDDLVAAGEIRLTPYQWGVGLDLVKEGDSCAA